MERVHVGQPGSSCAFSSTPDTATVFPSQSFQSGPAVPEKTAAQVRTPSGSGRAVGTGPECSRPCLLRLTRKAMAVLGAPLAQETRWSGEMRTRPLGWQAWGRTQRTRRVRAPQGACLHRPKQVRCAPASLSFWKEWGPSARCRAWLCSGP